MNNALARRQLLERIYKKMSPEEQRLFVLLSMQNKSTDEIMQAIRTNQQHLQRIVQHIDKDKWWVAFGSDVAANFFTDGLAWLARRLFKR